MFQDRLSNQEDAVKSFLARYADRVLGCLRVVSRQVVEIEFGASPYRASYPIAAISSSSGASSRGRSSSRMDSALK